tara:strand:+ start:413 stop:1360 length:948 start_codon:yes stop_codon:yes gene_type:complete
MAPRYGSKERPYLWPLKKDIVGGQEGWLDPRSPDIPKLLPTKLGRIEGELDIRNLHRQNLADQKSKDAWFRNTVKETIPDSASPGRNVGGPENMRALLRENTQRLGEQKRLQNWEKGWSLLNQSDIAELQGVDAKDAPKRITNKEAEGLFQAEEQEFASKAKLREDGLGEGGVVPLENQRPPTSNTAQTTEELIAKDSQLTGQGGRPLGETTRRNTANDVDTKSTIEKTEPQTPTTPTTPVTQKAAESTMKISEMAGKAHTVLANLANIASILDTGTGPGATLHKRPSKTDTNTPKGEQQSSEGKTWDPDKQMWV